jgi:hypothetical protein
VKLTEAKLKQLIVEVLEEGMKTIADLPEGTFIKIDGHGKDFIEIYYADESGKESNKFLSPDNPEMAQSGGGVVGLDYESQLADEFPCLNAMMISFSAVETGWGPLLYDIAMEVATLLGGGLVSDRTIVSDFAYGVWDKYENNRSDVEVVQLDNEQDSFKNGKQDDCLQNSSRKWSKKLNKDWDETSISKMFKKEPTTLIALRDQGKLIIQDVELNF